MPTKVYRTSEAVRRASKKYKKNHTGSYNAYQKQYYRNNKVKISAQAKSRRDKKKFILTQMRMKDKMLNQLILKF